MRVICKKCKDIKEFGSEQREKYAKIVREDNLNIKDYLALINIAMKHKGKCSSTEGHEYILEDTYKADVDKIIDIYKANIASKDADSRSLEDTQKTVIDLKKMVSEYEEKITGFETNIKSNEENLEYAQKSILKTTGIEMNSWLL
jgi:DNA repair exonuclease SbcCD nuclease subunit